MIPGETGESCKYCNHIIPVEHINAGRIMKIKEGGMVHWNCDDFIPKLPNTSEVVLVYTGEKGYYPQLAWYNDGWKHDGPNGKPTELKGVKEWYYLPHSKNLKDIECDCGDALYPNTDLALKLGWKYIEDKIVCANCLITSKKPKFKCYEIHRPNIPDSGCIDQCKECSEIEYSE